MNRLLRPLLVSAVLIGGTAACREPAPAVRTDPAAAEAAQAGYAAPPRVERVQVSGGVMVVQGVAAPGARVRITDGQGAYGGTADGQGAWRVETPTTSAVRLLTVAAESGQRTLEAEGRLLVLPGPSALLLRPGHGALPVGPAPSEGARIVSIDVASDGAAAVSGLAAPSSPAVTRIDGVPPDPNIAVGSGAADASGRFSIILARPLGPGEHLVEVSTPGGVARANVAVAPLDPGPAPFVAASDPAGWRVAWRAPGGGVQTTYVLRPPAAS